MTDPIAEARDNGREWALDEIERFLALVADASDREWIGDLASVLIARNLEDPASAFALRSLSSWIEDPTYAAAHGLGESPVTGADAGPERLRRLDLLRRAIGLYERNQVISRQREDIERREQTLSSSGGVKLGMRMRSTRPEPRTPPPTRPARSPLRPEKRPAPEA